MLVQGTSQSREQRRSNQGSRHSIHKQMTRMPSMLTHDETEDLLQKTEKQKMSGTFFFTAGADAIQCMPSHKFDRRIIAMYQRQLWEQ